MRLIVLAAVLGLLAPIAASAEDAQPVMQPASVQQKQPLICHYFYHEGMVIRRPDCRTAEAWTYRRIHEQEYFREFQMGSLIQHN